MTNPTENGNQGGRLSDDEAARLSEHISGLTSAGLPLASGLRATAAEMPRGRLRSTLISIADALDDGASVEEAVASQGKRLPGHLRGLVLIGTKTGKISQALGRFVACVSVGADLRRMLWTSLAYPMFAIILAVCIGVFICSSLVGSFDAIFRDFGIPLPVMTTVLLSLSRLLRFDAATTLEMGLILCVVVGLLLSSPVRRNIGLSRVPLLGAVWRNTALAEFCHLLALLLESEVPLPEALRLTADGVNDANIDRACEGMGEDVERGMTLSQSIVSRSIFPRGLVRILHWAEGHQSLPESLHMAGEMFESSARAQANLAGTVLGVLVVLAILGGVALLIVGLLLPMFTLLSRLSG